MITKVSVLIVGGGPAGCRPASPSNGVTQRRCVRHRQSRAQQPTRRGGLERVAKRWIDRSSVCSDEAKAVLLRTVEKDI